MTHHRGDYPTDWPHLAHLVKSEAGRRCTRCAARHDPQAGYTLTVHHLDGDKSNLARWNLAPLCQRCHLTIQGRVDLRQAYLYMPSTWILPYLAGYYAHTPEAARPPAYDLPAWAARYQAETDRPWPPWAPPPGSPSPEND